MWFMSKTKLWRCVALALAVLLFLTPAVSASEPKESEEEEEKYVPQDLIDLTQVQEEVITYETVEVVRGSFVNEVNVPTSPYRAFDYNLKFPRNDAKFLEFTVKKGDEVKKGDVLARFTVEKSEVELTRLSLSLQRAREQTEEGIRQREDAIKQKRAEVKTLSDAYEKKMAELSIKKMETELKQYKLRQERSLSGQEKAYEEEKVRYATDVLVSPADGVVTELEPMLKDMPIYSGQTLVTVSASSSGLLVAENHDGLRYNMPVRVKAKNEENEEVYLPGRIVAADNAIPAAERTGFVLIEVEPYDEKKFTVVDKPRVYAHTMQMDDVFVVPTQSRAIKQEDDKYYVQKLKDGITQKRYIQRDPIFSSFADAWVFSGVEEGDTLILH